MCDPITAGVATFAQGALGAVGQYQSSQLDNEQAIAQYEYQLAQRKHAWMMDLSTWGHRRLEYKNTVDENNYAAGRGYAAEQERLNEAFQQAAFQNQDQMIQLLQAQGALGGERQGNSAARLNNAVLSQYGRNNATMAANLVSARDAMRTRNEDIRLQLKSANNKAYSEVALKPIAGIAPPQPILSDPGMGLALGLASATAAGIGQYASLKAPNPGGGGGGGNSLPGANPSNFRTDLTIPGVNYTPPPSSWTLPTNTNAYFDFKNPLLGN